MKKSKSLFWSLIAVGTLGVFASIFSYADGADFNSYFWGGFCGVILIFSAVNEQKEKAC